jgi:hypothetical protein
MAHGIDHATRIWDDLMLLLVSNFFQICAGALILGMILAQCSLLPIKPQN